MPELRYRFWTLLVFLLIIATILGGLAARRASRGGGPSVSARVATGLVSVLLLAYLVAVWAMRETLGRDVSR